MFLYLGMRNLILLVLIIKITSCQENRIDNLDQEIFRNSSISEPIKIPKGVYYTTDFIKKDGFNICKKKPEVERHQIIYQLDFKNNGEIIFNDLTGFYGCGNGVLKMDSCFFNRAKNNYPFSILQIYLLQF